MDELEKDFEVIINKIKEKIKEQFWIAKGYPKLTTQNHGIIEEGIDFGIEAMRHIK